MADHGRFWQWHFRFSADSGFRFQTFGLGLNPLTAFPLNVFVFALVLFALLALLLGVGVMLMKEKLKPFVKGFVLFF